jgi:hypothetical protein
VSGLPDIRRLNWAVVSCRFQLNFDIAWGLRSVERFQGIKVASIFAVCRTGCLTLALAGIVNLSVAVNGHANGQTPSDSGKQDPNHSVELPADLQAQLGKLEEALRSAKIGGDAKAEAHVRNKIAGLYFRASMIAKALDSYNEALILSRTLRDRFALLTSLRIDHGLEVKCFLVGRFQFQRLLQCGLSFN